MWHKIIEITSASFTSIVRLANIMQQVGSSIFLFAFHFHSLELEYCLQINIFLCASCDYKSVAYLIFYFIARTFSSLSLNVCLFPLSPLLSPLDSRSLVAYNKQLCGFANCMIHFVYMYLCTVKELARHIGIYKRSNWMKNAVEREMELWNELIFAYDWDSCHPLSFSLIAKYAHNKYYFCSFSDLIVIWKEHLGEKNVKIYSLWHYISRLHSMSTADNYCSGVSLSLCTCIYITLLLKYCNSWFRASLFLFCHFAVEKYLILIKKGRNPSIQCIATTTSHAHNNCAFNSWIVNELQRGNRRKKSLSGGKRKKHN